MGEHPYDGGPAFPLPEIRGPDGEGMFEAWGGMSLRDYIAIEVAPALYAELAVSSRIAQANFVKSAFLLAAEGSYKFADAMLAARQKGAGQ